MGLTGFRGRVVSLTILLSLLIVSVSVVLTQLLLGRTTDAETRALARTRADAVAATVTVTAGRVHVVEGPPDQLDAVAWVYADGRLVDGEVPRSLAGAAAQLASADRARFATVAGNLMYAAPVAVPGHHVTAVVTVSLAPYERSERHSLYFSLGLGLLAVLLAGAVAHLVVRQSMLVVHRMSALADDWGEHNSERRFGVGQPHDEFGELARTLDRMLDRVAAALDDERRLTDEVAHELRTPMTVLRGEAQLAQQQGASMDPATVLVELDRLQAAVTSLLDAARARMRSEGWCGLSAALRAAVGARPIQDQVADDLEVGLPADVVQALLAPLVDNATRHARSQVTVRAERSTDDHGDAVLVHVLDDGPGFTPDEVDRAFEPGASGGDGHGLGLAVVRRIAVAAGASVRAVPEGRGHVEVRLPARPPA